MIMSTVNENVCKNVRCKIPIVGDYVKLNGSVYNIESLFLDDYYTKVRSCVRSSMARMTGREDMYIGYVYKGKEGKYKKYYITGGVENIARFICSSVSNKMLCNDRDLPLLCAMGDYLDLIKSDTDVKEELICCLKQYHNKKERPLFMEL